jgi:uncharacterized protein
MNAIAAPKPFIELSGFRFRLWPVVLAGILMEVVLIGGRELARWLLKLAPEGFYVGWTFMATALFFQALFAYLCILVMRRVLPQADDHIRWPPEQTYVGAALLIGVGMGLVMLIADYWPEIAALRAPSTPYDVAPLPAVAMLMALLCTGFAEETLFRGLLVGMLVVLVPGRLRIGRVDLPVAAYIVSFLFGIAHWESFVVDPLHLAIAQQIYAFVWGLIYVWLMERSKSLLAPIVAHGVGNAVEVGIVMWMIATLPPA